MPADAATLRSHRLLLQAALAGPDGAAAAWRQWSGDFGLDHVGGEAYWILPCVHRNLARIDEPLPDRARLAGVYKQARMRRALARPRLLDLMGALTLNDCRPMPGPLLALGLDDEGAAIPVDGTDLLVPVGRLDVASAVLSSRGWRPLRPPPPMELRAFFASCRYRHSQGGDVTLRWRPFGPDAALGHDVAIWERARAARAGAAYPELPHAGDRLLMANRCDSLLKLCMVLARLLPIVNGKEIAARAHALGLGRPWQRFDVESSNSSLAGLPASLLEGPLDFGWLPRPDEQVSLPRLLARHWRRYRRCPRGFRPRGFARYMVRYYQNAWQPPPGNPML